MKNRKAQMKIQQMAFMIVAVFFFFILVALFFLGWQYKNIRAGAGDLQREQAISSLSVIASMTELNCDAREELCLDEDKLEVMSGGNDYDGFWPVASVKVYKIQDEKNWVVFDSGQEQTKEYSTYVVICKKISDFGYVYDDCEIGKLVVGVKIYE